MPVASSTTNNNDDDDSFVSHDSSPGLQRRRFQGGKKSLRISRRYDPAPFEVYSATSGYNNNIT